MDRLQQEDDQVKTITQKEAGGLTVAKSKAGSEPAPFKWEPEIGGENRPDLEKLCREGYASDQTFRKILQNPKDHKSFEVDRKIIYYSANSGNWTMCIPHSEFRGRRLTKLVIDQIHRTVGHMGPHITENYARRHFWWPTFGSDVKLFVSHARLAKRRRQATEDRKVFYTHYQYPQDRGHQLEWTL